MATALQLVNRVLVRIGENKVNDSGTFTSHAGEDALEFVNESKRLVLETRVWNFDRRRDYLLLIPTQAATALVVANGAAGVIGGISSISETLSGEFRMRLRVASDATHGHVSYPVRNMQYFGGVGGISGALEDQFEGTGVGAGTGDLFAAEYQLPIHAVSATNSADVGSKYRQILSIKDEHEEVKLVHVDEDFDLDVWVPRLHDNLGERPSVVYVGGKTLETTATSAAAQTLKDQLVVWPVPDEAVRLEYTGVYRHPELTIPADTLDNVDPVVEDMIVSLAQAKWLQGPGRDVQTGAVLEGLVLRNAQAVWEGTRRQPQERNPLHSLDRQSGGTGTDFGRIPRSVESL